MFCTFSRLLYAERYGNIQLPKGKTTKKNGGKHNGSIRNRKGKSNGKQNGLERKNRNHKGGHHLGG